MVDEFWTSRLDQVTVALDSLRDAIAAKRGALGDDITDRAQEALADAEFVGGRIRALVATSDPRMIAMGTLQSVANRTESLRTAIAEGESDAAPDENQIFEEIDALVAQLPALALVTLIPEEFGDTAENFIQRLAAAQQDADESLGAVRARAASIEEAIAQARGRLDEISTSAEEAEQRVAQMVSDAQTTTDAQVAQAESTIQSHVAGAQQRFDQEVARVDSRIATDEGRLDEALRGNQAQFSEAQAERLAEWTETSGNLTTKVNEFIAARESQMEATQEKLDEHEERARSIVAISAASSHAEAYVQDAARERNTADRWRLIGLVLLVSAGVAAVGLFVSSTPDNSAADITRYVLGRGAIVATLAVVGYIALGQSGKHRDREEFARRLANELTVLRPYLEELKDEQREDLLKGRVSTYFKGGEGTRALGDRNDRES